MTMTNNPCACVLKCLFVTRIFYRVLVGQLSALLRGTDFRFQLDKLLGHLVGGPLGQDPHHRHARLVGVNARAQRTPAHTALTVGDVPQLDHGHADHPVGPAKAVVLHRHLELIAVRGVLPQDAAEQKKRSQNSQLPCDRSNRIKLTTGRPRWI